MTQCDVCLAWNWEYDADFVALFVSVCQANGLSLLTVGPDNLEGVLQSLSESTFTCRVFWDRASDSDSRFLPLVEWACQHVARYINAHEASRRAWDKSIMHEALREAACTPTTIILPAHNEQPVLLAVDLTVLGSHFSIKPARRGGGEGVVIMATSLEQVAVARQEYPADRYLLQTHIEPVQIGSRPAWFRVIYCLGDVFPCWWDAQTHVYTPVTAGEESLHGLSPLRHLTYVIAERCSLDLFSCEIALNDDNSFVVVDYVNDPLDLRLQSQCVDGVPDHIVAAVADRVARLAIQRSQREGQ
jgi:hypothetical protein